MSCAAMNPPDGGHTPWNFCPSFSASVAFTILFAIIMVAHIVQAVIYKKGYHSVIIFSALLQVLTYAFRDGSIKKPETTALYSAQFILIMIAPIFTNAYTYMVQGRMTYNFTESGVIMKIPAWRFSTVFVGMDIVAFLIQIAGAGIAASNATSDPPDYVASNRGIHVYMAGIAFQQVAILFFISLAVQLHLILRKQPKSAKRNEAFMMLYTQYAVVLLITGRIIFRMIEYSQGVVSDIPDTEWYQYVFDSTFMMIALVLYNIFHPSRIMPGKESDLPTKKERKQAKREGRRVAGRALVQQGEKPLPSQDNSDIETGYAPTGRPY